MNSSRLNKILTAIVIIAFFIIVALITWLILKQGKGNLDQNNTPSPPPIAYVEWTGEKTPLGLTANKYSEIGDELITITGIVNNMYKDSGHYYIVLVFKDHVDPKIIIDLGAADTNISFKTVENVVTNEDGNVMSGTEVHTVKSAQEIYELLTTTTGNSIKVQLLTSTPAQVSDEDCNDYCKKYLNVFNTYKESNNQLLQDGVNNKFQPEYNVGSVVEISI